jgi:hypothetical protein
MIEITIAAQHEAQEQNAPLNTVSYNDGAGHVAYGAEHLPYFLLPAVRAMSAIEGGDSHPGDVAF